MGTLNRALIYQHIVDASLVNANASVANPTFLRNAAQGNYSGVPIPMSGVVAGKYSYQAATATSPACSPNFHTTTSMVPVFNKDFGIFNPNYDVVELFAIGNYIATRDAYGLKCATPVVENALGIYVTANAQASTLTMQMPVDQLEDLIGGYAASKGILTTDLSNIVSDDAANVTITAGAATPTLAPDLKIRNATIVWKFFTGQAMSVATPFGGATWFSVRFHKYNPAAPGQLKISVASNIFDSGNSVRTLTLTLSGASIGSAVGSGLLINAPRAAAGYNIAHMIYAYDIANNTLFNGANWHLDIKAQGDKFISLAAGNQDLTAFSQLQTGPYVAAPDPFPDINPSRTGLVAKPIRLSGRIGDGLEVVLRTTAYDLDCFAGGVGGVTGGLAKVQLVARDGTTVDQFLKTWGANKLNYLGNANPTNNQYLGQIRIKIVKGAIADLRGCKFVVIDPSGAVEFEIPISIATYSGNQLITG